jgi:RsiW-degrading membrane proteinase PrsW (M82 family)
VTVTGKIRRRLQISGILVMTGLLVEAICLLWSRPIAFVVFASLSGFLIGLGVLLFLYSLVSLDHPPPPNEHTT